MSGKKTIIFIFIIIPFLLFSEPEPVASNQVSTNNNASSLPLNNPDCQQSDEQAEIARFNAAWQRGEVQADEKEYLKHMCSLSDNYAENKDESVASVGSDMPVWLVDSSIKRMPILLQGIFNYLKLHSSDGLIASYHRFMLVGKPGVGKTTLARSIAQALGYEIFFIHASELFGKYRNHTAINLRMFFDRAKVGTLRKAIIIDELHKLFENHEYKRTDDAVNATAFWNEIDELEKQYPNIMVIGTANSVEHMPAEIKSRFHGKIITISLPDKRQQEQVLQEIIAHDASIQLDLSVDTIFLNKLVCQLGDYSLRDIQLLVDAAKMFKYAGLDRIQSLHYPLLLKRHHFELALAQLAQENKERLYKRLKPFLKELNMNVHTAAELGFVISLCVGAGQGVHYLVPLLLQKLHSHVDSKNSVQT